MGAQHSTWRQLFHQRFWFGPRVRALVRHGNYSQQKADVLCAFLEELLRPPYLLAAVVAHTTPAGMSDTMAYWLLQFALYFGGLPLAECFVNSMVSAYMAIGESEKQNKKSERSVSTTTTTTATARNSAEEGKEETRGTHLMSTETCSKMITRYFHLVGDAYLHELLADLLIDIGKRRKKASNKAKKGHDNDNVLHFGMSRDTVVEIAQDAYAIIERIVQNLDRMPQPLRRVCQHIYAETARSGQGWHFVRLCLFYRFVFPSIVDSSQYEVFSEEVKDYDLQTYLVVVAKVLQSLCQLQEESAEGETEEEQPAAAGGEADQAQSHKANITKLMTKFMRQLLRKDDIDEATCAETGAKQTLKAHLGTAKALQALEQLSAHIKLKPPRLSLFADCSSPEYGERIRRLLQEVCALEDLPAPSPDAAPRANRYSSDKQRCLLC